MNQLRWSKERLKLPMKNEKGCVSGGNEENINRLGILL